MFLVVLLSVLRGPLTILILVGGIGERGRISTPSANEPVKDHILVHTVMIKAHFSGRMVSSGISDVSEKKRLKKLIMIIIMKNRKKQRFLAFPVSDFHYETKVRK